MADIFSPSDELHVRRASKTGTQPNAYSDPLYPLVLKRGLDLSVSTIFLVFFAPILVAIAALILVTQGRPLLIRHKRVGRDGNLFSCLKFRTMTTNADAVLRDHIAANPEARAEWEATRKLKNDPRVTRIGGVMRKLSIDELPQLVNIARGEMSLVGPRPIVTDEIKFYGSDFEHYQSVRPGLTGLWQISGRSDVSYPRRVQLDTDYVVNWTLGRDIMILLKTVPAVLWSKGSY